jgi:hypothetical protein
VKFPDPKTTVTGLLTLGYAAWCVYDWLLGSGDPDTARQAILAALAGIGLIVAKDSK